MRERRPLNWRNPLTQYKQKNGLDWADITKITGLHVATLRRIAQKDETGIKYVSYNSVKIIKDTIGVDIISDWVK